jgi:hypothetical protein
MHANIKGVFYVQLKIEAGWKENAIKARQSTNSVVDHDILVRIRIRIQIWIRIRTNNDRCGAGSRRP